MNSRTVTRLILAAALLVPIACNRRAGSHGTTSATETELPALTIADVAGRIARHEPLGIFDANGHNQYENGHVPGARWVAFNDVHASDLPADRNTPLVFYCHNEQ